MKFDVQEAGCFEGSLENCQDIVTEFYNRIFG